MPANSATNERERSLQQLAWRALLHHPPLLDHGHPAGQRHRLVVGMGDDDRRHRRIPQHRGQLRGNRAARGRIERRQRLVQQQRLRLQRKRPRQRHPLPLAAGQPRRAGSRQVPDPDPLEQRIDVGAVGAVGDVLAHRHVREQRVVLEHEPATAPLRRQIAPVAEPEVAVALDAAARGRIEPRDQAQQRGLAGTGRADDGQHAVDVELHVQREAAQLTCHRGVKRRALPTPSSLTVRSTPPLAAISTAAVASPASRLSDSPR